jgi:hypothetical protein
MNLNRAKFLKAVKHGETLLKELKKDYPELGLKPVFSRFGARSGQCDLTTDMRKIVLEFPEMLTGEEFDRGCIRRPRMGPEGGSGIPAASHEQAQRRNETSGRVQDEERLSREGTQGAQKIKKLRELLKAIKRAEKDGEKEIVSKLWKEAEALEKELLAPDLPLYCGDVLIEFRPENLKYESLRRLQQDSRLPPGLNEVGNIRVIAGSLEFLSKEV